MNKLERMDLRMFDNGLDVVCRAKDIPHPRWSLRNIVGDLLPIEGRPQVLLLLKDKASPGLGP